MAEHKADAKNARSPDPITFGPFSLIARERLLLKDGAAVQLGARALDILIALLSRPNQPLDKRQLLAEVWPDATVTEGSLRFHMVELRKALGDGADGARYITTLPGRGYCFVAPISQANGRDRAQVLAAVPTLPPSNVPSRLTRMVGRTESVLMLSSQLTATRFVTIVGAGGVGKTTVAVTVGHELIEAFAGAVFFADLGTLTDPDLTAASVASILGLAVQTEDPATGLIAYLRDKRLVLILDNCEHLVEVVAALAARIFVGAPKVHILATSREALRVEGEYVYKLAPLAVPPQESALTAAEALTFPAVQLFAERAAASGASLDLSDAAVTVVAGICRKLDGVALAIELAAARVGAYGLQKTAALLEERLSLVWQGQRGAPPRHQTLKATLDWSYRLLSDLERQVLRRLAVFVGDFTLDAALAVLATITTDATLVFATIDSLVAKSMVSTRTVGAMMRYRLLDTTRSYALENDTDPSDVAGLAARHAGYYRAWLEQAKSDSAETPHRSDLGNVRAALEWCFSTDGDRAIGVGLAAGAAPLFLSVSMLNECRRWSERAIGALDDAARNSPDEMHLQAALGISLMLTRGNSEAVLAALNRGLAIAEQNSDAMNQIYLLALLHIFHHRTGDFKAVMRYANRGSALSHSVTDPAAIALNHALLGSALHHLGDVAAARRELEKGLRPEPGPRQGGTAHLDFDHYNYAEIALARTLWLQGHPGQAADLAQRAIEHAASIIHPVPLSRALVWGVSVFLWTGDVARAERHVDWLIGHAETHSLAPYQAVGLGYQGELAISRGDARTGVRSLEASLAMLHQMQYELLTTAFNVALAQGLAALGQVAEAVALAGTTIRLVEESGALLYLPEVLRAKGAILRMTPLPDVGNAEDCFKQSLAFSRRQGALAWELRAATDLAALWVDEGRTAAAKALLQPVLARFTEGAETTDLKAAEQLMATWR
jgi:predicted ATPase/DNA-binding winged helix-turn-helix (wHTH) protein